MSFDKKASEWDASARRQALAQAVAQAIKSTIPITPSQRVLDFGAGTGLLTQRLLPYVGEMVACDTSDKMLEKLTEKMPATICKKSDILSFDDENGFDLVVSSMTMHHIEDLSALFAKLHHLLHPGGYLAIADLASEDGTFHDHGNEGVHHFGFDEGQLRAIAQKAGFENIGFDHIYTIIKNEDKAYDIFLLHAKKPLSN